MTIGTYQFAFRDLILCLFPTSAVDNFAYKNFFVDQVIKVHNVVGVAFAAVATG